jgi:hypothetical protein
LASTATAAVSVPTAKKILLPEALLADGTAADQGFHVTQAAQPTVLDQLSTCQAPLNQPVAAQAGYQAEWIGATSATTLREYVADYPGGQAAAVVARAKQALGCATESRDGVTYQVSQVALAPLAGVDSQFAWCALSARQASCEAVFGSGELLADLEIVTTTEAKAKNLLATAAPLAAGAVMAANR